MIVVIIIINISIISRCHIGSEAAPRASLGSRVHPDINCGRQGALRRHLRSNTFHRTTGQHVSQCIVGGRGLLWQSQAEAYPVHQLRKPKATIALAASAMLIFLLLVSIGAGIRRRQNSKHNVEKLHAALARLYVGNFTIEYNRGPTEREDSYGVASAKSMEVSSPLLAFGSENSNRSTGQHQGRG
ncbi:hypothetical protein HPB50_003281 [Hyalomma asiaticum]|uniref:Uncharacterized protein n=1 Tax=Hyalomma asiaticum TaxID=266040 RepID=A0ACB7TDS0_HYAAI|nr:hypothetical protein HPB50_003281 [Hyalomma asiaticum]